MSVEVSTNKLVDLRLGIRVKILELMHRLEFDNVETVGKDAVGFPFKEMFTFVGSDMGNRREDISTVSCRAFNAVSMIDAALPSFVVDIKVLKVVVEIDRAGTEVAT